MKSKVWLLFLSALLFILTVKAQNPFYSITHNSITRSYLLHLPTNFSATDTLPLVFCFHGLNQTPGRMAQVSGFDTIADREHFIVSYPLGVDTVWNTFSNPYHSGTDDIGFVSALIDTIQNNYHINLNRVYATGMSNGGFLSYKLACELSERIAAIAPLAGAFTDSMRYYCHANRPMPVLDIHGTSDFVVGYNQGILNIPVPSTLNYWVQYNNCPVTEVSTTMPNISTTDNCDVTKLEWLPCNGQSEVIHYKVNGGGHTWPGSSVDFGGLGGKVNHDIDASEVIWEFFNRHSLQGAINSIDNANAEVSAIEIYPNPTTENINVVLRNNTITQIQLTDLNGKLILEKNVNANHLQLSLSSIIPGFYFLTWFSKENAGSNKIFKM